MRDDEDIQELDRTLLVRMDDIERLTTLWTERWKRPLAPSELRGIVDDFVREEVLYREALALGLDENDKWLAAKRANAFDLGPVGSRKHFGIRGDVGNFDRFARRRDLSDLSHTEREATEKAVQRRPLFAGLF